MTYYNKGFIGIKSNHYVLKSNLHKKAIKHNFGSTLIFEILCPFFPILTLVLPTIIGQRSMIYLQIFAENSLQYKHGSQIIRLPTETTSNSVPSTIILNILAPYTPKSTNQNMTKVRIWHLFTLLRWETDPFCNFFFGYWLKTQKQNLPFLPQPRPNSRYVCFSLRETSSLVYLRRELRLSLFRSRVFMRKDFKKSLFSCRSVCMSVRTQILRKSIFM